MTNALYKLCAAQLKRARSLDATTSHVHILSAHFFDPYKGQIFVASRKGGRFVFGWTATGQLYWVSPRNSGYVEGSPERFWEGEAPVEEAVHRLQNALPFPRIMRLYGIIDNQGRTAALVDVGLLHGIVDIKLYTLWGAVTPRLFKEVGGRVCVDLGTWWSLVSEQKLKDIVWEVQHSAIPVISGGTDNTLYIYTHGRWTGVSGDAYYICGSFMPFDQARRIGGRDLRELVFDI